MAIPMFVLLVLLGLILHYSHQAMHKDFGGPYEIDVHYFENCKEEEQGTKTISATNVRSSKLNRTVTSHSMTIILNTTFDDNNDLHFKVAQWGNGGWIENFFDKKITTPFSFAAKTAPAVAEPFYKLAGVDKPPFQPGVYYLKDYFLRPGDLNIPALPYNKYKAKIFFMDKDSVMGCIIVYLDVNRLHKNKG